MIGAFLIPWVIFFIIVFFLCLVFTCNWYEFIWWMLMLISQCVYLITAYIKFNKYDKWITAKNRFLYYIVWYLSLPIITVLLTVGAWLLIFCVLNLGGIIGDFFGIENGLHVRI